MASSPITSWQIKGRNVETEIDFIFLDSKITVDGVCNHESKEACSLKEKLKILQARLQQYMNCELPDAQVGFRKGRGTRDQIANILWIMEKQESSRKTSISALLTMPKPLTVWITINCGKF